MYTSLPPPPHTESPIVYVTNNAIFYVHKGHHTHQVPTTRRELIECPLDAAHYDPNIILLIHERVINANCFAVLISFDMKTSVVKFHGCQINQDFTLTTATGQTQWDAFGRAQLWLYSIHEQYNRQLSTALLQRFTRVVFARLYTLSSTQRFEIF